MRIVTPKRGTVPTKPTYIPPPIPFERSNGKDDDESGKARSATRVGFDLRATPADPNSQTYKISLNVFSDGTPEEWLLHVKDLRKVIYGQNCTTGPQKFALARRVLDGDAAAVFETAAQNRGNETNDNFELVLQDVTKHIFPRRALQVQRRYMRRRGK